MQMALVRGRSAHWVIRACLAACSNKTLRHLRQSSPSSAQLSFPAGLVLCYDWKSTGLWNLVFLAGVLVGGFLASHPATPCHQHLLRTVRPLRQIGIHDFSVWLRMSSYVACRCSRCAVRLHCCRRISGRLWNRIRGRLHIRPCHQWSANFELPSLIAVFAFSPVASSDLSHPAFVTGHFMTDASTSRLRRCGSSGADQQIRPAFLLVYLLLGVASRVLTRSEVLSWFEFKRCSTSIVPHVRHYRSAIARQLLPSHSSKLRSQFCRRQPIVIPRRPLGSGIHTR